MKKLFEQKNNLSRLLLAVASQKTVSEVLECNAYANSRLLCRNIVKQFYISCCEAMEIEALHEIDMEFMKTWKLFPESTLCYKPPVPETVYAILNVVGGEYAIKEVFDTFDFDEGLSPIQKLAIACDFKTNSVVTREESFVGLEVVELSNQAYLLLNDIVNTVENSYP